MITEGYMQPGNFRVAMDIATPHLMTTVTRGGYLVITPQHLGDPRGFTDASLLAAARYTGIVLETIWKDGILTLEGAGLEWWMGDLDGIGWPCPTVSYSADPASTVIALSSGTGIIPENCYTIGSTITGGNYTGSHSSTETVKDVLMQVMDSLGAHYKISPNGEINCEDVGDDNIYQDTPTVVFVRDNWGSDALWVGAPVESLTTKYSIREWLSASYVYMYGLQDAPVTRTDTTTTSINREILGKEMQMQDIRTSHEQIGASVSAGDNVYIYDPGSGFEGTDVIKFRGQYLQPISLRIREHQWPVVDGMGVYYRPGGTSIDADDWVDLTLTTKLAGADTAMSTLRTWTGVQGQQPT